jgi:cell division protein FtsI/penicillin-binding protein 2
VSRRLPNRRIRLLLALFVLAFALAFGRAVWLQAIHARGLDRLAQGQHHSTVTVPAPRGSMFDRNGVELAIGRRAVTVYANPQHIANPHAAAVAAGRALRLDPDRLYALLADRSRGFVYVARKADARRAAALEREKIAGFGFYPEERRVYPHGRVGAHVLGYAGIDNKGLSGLELALDETLAGRSGRETIVRDPFGRAIDVIGAVPSVEGRDVKLTLDATLQANAESVLLRAVRKWGALAATAVVLDPHTGEVLAMAVEPGFDANRFPEAPREIQRNRTVTDTFEPGSTLKVVTVAGALADGLVSPSTQFILRPKIKVADRVIGEPRRTETEQLTVAEIVAHSSNVGTVTLAQLLGRDRLTSWLRRFGFGQRTGVDFPGESKGILPGYWSGSTIGTLPIGHGIAVTPVQMAAAYGTVANGGVWLQPHLVDRVGSRGRAAVAARRILAPRVARQVLRMMEDVVIEGTGQEAQLPGYTVAGKTGTAAKPDPDGGYSTSRYVASFVGIVPAKKPRLVILVTVDEPAASIWGGVVAAPAFQQIAGFDLQYLEIPPDAPETLPAQQ